MVCGGVKGSIVDIKHFSVHDGPGIRTTVFLKGCPLCCVWCHNPESISEAPELCYYEKNCLNCGQCIATCPRNAHRMAFDRHIFIREDCISCGLCVNACLGNALALYGKKMNVSDVFEIVMEDESFYRETGGGITLSGGEPLLQVSFCAELLGLAKQKGLHTAIDTCGAIAWENFQRVLPVTDLFLYDIKHMDSALHMKWTGSGNELIRENLIFLSQTGASIEIRIPLIPGYNDDSHNIAATGEFLSGIIGVKKVVIIPYHNLSHSKYQALGLSDTLPKAASPSDEILQKTTEHLCSFGLDVVSGRD
jgi:pyruvate formate lyase activating enzyme